MKNPSNRIRGDIDAGQTYECDHQVEGGSDSAQRVPGAPEVGLDLEENLLCLKRCCSTDEKGTPRWSSVFPFVNHTSQQNERLTQSKLYGAILFLLGVDWGRRWSWLWSRCSTAGHTAAFTVPTTATSFRWCIRNRRGSNAAKSNQRRKKPRHAHHEDEHVDQYKARNGRKLVHGTIAIIRHGSARVYWQMAVSVNREFQVSRSHCLASADPLVTVQSHGGRQVWITADLGKILGQSMDYSADRRVQNRTFNSQSCRSPVNSQWHKRFVFGWEDSKALNANVSRNTINSVTRWFAIGDAK